MTRPDQIQRQIQFYTSIIEQQEHLLKVYANIRKIGGSIPGGQESSIAVLLEANKRKLAMYQEELRKLKPLH